MRLADPRLAAYGVTSILVGILIALLVGQPAFRVIGSATAIVGGGGILRQAFRLE